MMASKFIFTTNCPPWTFYNGVEGVTLEALMRRITVFVHRVDFDTTKFYFTVNDAQINF